MSLNGAHADVTIAVDAMGGDFAPAEVVSGAVAARREGTNVVLVGIPQEVQPFLSDSGEDVPLVPAGEVIAMDESVGSALRRQESSLHIAADLVAEEKAAGVVSCGNSAAIMAVALRSWGLQPGIDRPAFGGTLPAKHGSVFVLDIGANSSVKPKNLVQFAVMGDMYARVSQGLELPRVALLSNGTEDNKGTKEIKEAHEVLRDLDLNFIGNIEGNQVFDDVADVVVCDGFTGNVLLKGAEGAVMEVFNLLKTELNRDIVSKVAAAALMPAFTRIKRRVDYEEYGGAPVLGVNGIMINCHGRSRAKAVTNAIFMAERMAREKLISRISAALHEEHVEAGRRRLRLKRALHLRHGEA